MQGRWGWGATFAAALLLVSGCGGSSSDQTATFNKAYAADLNELRQTAGQIGNAIQTAGPKTDAALQAQFQTLATQWQDEAGRLKSLKPPSSVGADFKSLTAATGRAGSDLNAIVAAAKAHSESAAKTAATSLLNDILAAKSADQPIRQKLAIK